MRWTRTGVLIFSVLAMHAALASNVSSPDAADVVPPQKIDRDSPEMSWWRESMKTRDQRIQWWRDSRFGMFVHWGVYSELGGTWEGKPLGGYSEHIQRRLKIPIPEYREKVAGAFNPTKFDADEWIRLAKAAGMDYFVITAKHHDGFAMYDSKVSDYNVVTATPWKHDPMRDLKAACEKHGVKFGFYYSHAFDWGDEFGPGNDWDFKNPGGDLNLYGGRNWWESEEGAKFFPRAQKYVNEKSIPQIQELIRNYQPAILWFDTPHKLPPSENARILRAVREAGPDVVVNGRLLRGYGDYDSTTDRPAEFTPHEGDWEGIPTTNESYGWNQNDHSHKPAPHFIRLLAKAAARGGNLLMNIGPRGDGTIDPPDIEILQGIARWMKVNGDSIHRTLRTPLPVQAWGESTLGPDGKTLYLHVFDWPSDGKLVVGGLESNVTSAWLMSDPARRPLNVTRAGDRDVIIEAPPAAPDQVDSVVVLKCDAPVRCDEVRLLSNTQSNTLRAFDGTLVGQTIRFGPGKKDSDTVERWSAPGDGVTWKVRLSHATTFGVSALYDAAETSAGGTYALRVNDGAPIKATVSAGKSRTDSLGTVRLNAGTQTLRVEPETIAGEELMRLRAIRLDLKAE